MDRYCDGVSELVDRNKNDCGRACRDIAINNELVEVVVHMQDLAHVEDALKYINARAIRLYFWLSRRIEKSHTRSVTDDLSFQTSFAKCKLLSAAGLKKVDTLRVNLVSDEQKLPCDAIIRLVHDLWLGPHVTSKKFGGPNHVTITGNKTYSKHFAPNDSEYASYEGVYNQGFGSGYRLGLTTTPYETFELMAKDMKENLSRRVLNKDHAFIVDLHDQNLSRVH